MFFNVKGTELLYHDADSVSVSVSVWVLGV